MVLAALVDKVLGALGRPTSSSKSDTRMVLLSTTLTASIALYTFHKFWHRRPKLPYPPGPPGVLFFGNTLDFPDSKTGFLPAKMLEWSKTYGLVFTIYVPIIGPMIICADPKLFKHITITRNYGKGFTYKLLKAVIGSQSIVILEGKEWAAKRKAFNPGFTPNFLKTMTTTMYEKMQRFVQCIEQYDMANNQPTNMLVRAQTFTSDVIVSIAFGEDWGGDEPHPARMWESEIAELSNGLIFEPFQLLFGFSRKRKIKYYEKLLDEEMMNILERRLAAMKNNNTSSSNTNDKDICSLAINQLKKTDGSLTMEDKISITHNLKTFYFAGHDTTAILISWATWLLSLHDDIANKIRAELDEHNITNELKADTCPSYDQFQKCTYLEAALKETLRLYPPASVARYTPDVDETYDGYTIGGALIILSTYVMHRHPLLWKRPEEFIPERWLDGSEDNLNEKWAPFSRGPRDCIGKYFALLEAKLAISVLLTRYDLECVNPQETPCARLTDQARDGAKVIFTPRKS